MRRLLVLLVLGGCGGAPLDCDPGYAAVDGECTQAVESFRVDCFEVDCTSADEVIEVDSITTICRWSCALFNGNPREVDLRWEKPDGICWPEEPRVLIDPDPCE